MGLKGVRVWFQEVEIQIWMELMGLLVWVDEVGEWVFVAGRRGGCGWSKLFGLCWCGSGGVGGIVQRLLPV